MTALQAFRNTVVVLVTLVAAYVLYRSIHILVVLIVAIVVASAIRPAIIWLTKRGVSSGLALVLVYLTLGIALFGLSALVLPPITRQLTDYITNDQHLADQLISAQTWFEQNASRITGSQITLFPPEQIQSTVTNLVNQLITTLPTLAAALGGLVGDFILVVVMGIYWLTARDQGVHFILQLFPLSRRSTIELVIEETENSLSTYLRGVVLVATFVGVANFIILRLLNVPNAISLAFIMGISTMLPIIGGYIGAGLSTLLALLSSPIAALLALASFLGVQQIETHFLTPRVMSRSVGLNPLLIIIVLFVGFELGDVIGAMLAAPMAGTIAILLRHFILDPRRAESEPQMVEGGILLERAPEAQPMPNTPKEGIIRLGS